MTTTAASVSRFELAFRRALFLLILLVVYLLFGTLLFWILAHGDSNQHSKTRVERQEKLDFERTELLNVLWAESISRSEHDWSLLANQKLDAYEKSLGGVVLRRQSALTNFEQIKIRTFSHSFHHSFLLITTIGGIDADSLNSGTKIFSILYAVFGIPLVCLYLDQCVNAIAALLPGGESARLVNKVHLMAAFFVTVGTAVVFDIVEQNDDDTPFIDVVFAVFLGASTIGANNSSNFYGHFITASLFYLTSVFSIGAVRVSLLTIQRRVERLIGGYEFAFTQKVAELERVISGDRLDNVQEESEEYREDEDSEIVDPTTVPVINMEDSYGENSIFFNPQKTKSNNNHNIPNRGIQKNGSSSGERVHFRLNHDPEEVRISSSNATYIDKNMEDGEDEWQEDSGGQELHRSDAFFTFKPVVEEDEGEEEEVEKVK